MIALGYDKKTLARHTEYAKNIGKKINIELKRTTGKIDIQGSLAKGYNVSHRCWKTYCKQLRKPHFKKVDLLLTFQSKSNIDL